MAAATEPHRSSTSSAVAQGCARTYAHVRNGAQRADRRTAICSGCTSLQVRPSLQVRI